MLLDSPLEVEVGVAQNLVTVKPVDIIKGLTQISTTGNVR